MKTKNLLTYCILVFFLLTVLLPMIWGISIAFRSNAEIAGMSGFSIRSLVPETVTLENFTRMFEIVNMGRVFAVTLYVSLSVTFLSLIINSMAAYAFARFEFPGKDFLFIVFVATMIVPIEILIIPLYGTLRGFGMIDKLSALILPFIANGFGIFFLRQFILGIPKELDEAAMIDGCSRLGIYLRIILPLTKPALLILGIIVFLQQWDSFLVPVTLISSESKMVLQVAINYLYAGIFFNNIGVLFAGMVIAAIPVIIVFMFLQRSFIEGIATSGIKG